MKCMAFLLLVRSTTSFSRNTNIIRPTTIARMSTEAIDIAGNLQGVQERVNEATSKSGRSASEVQLVAVSKTKPHDLLMQAYDAGCRTFGENYAQELMEKTVALPTDIQWHFIGNLQSNKCNKLVNSFDTVERLTIETVPSTKLADKLQNSVSNKQETGNLKIYVQINTSGEESKSGAHPDECIGICQHILENCPRLELSGLMTIGAVGDLKCFEALRELRDEASDKLGMKLGLSMGMSGDFEDAILAGATNVRVGSTIFGARDYSK